MLRVLLVKSQLYHFNACDAGCRCMTLYMLVHCTMGFVRTALIQGTDDHSFVRCSTIELTAEVLTWPAARDLNPHHPLSMR